MSTLANSFISTGQATAWERGTSPERMAERSNAYAQKEQADQALRQMKATEPTEQDYKTMRDAQTVELQNALETQKQMLRENNKRSVFSAYERYDGDGDVKHINTMITDLRANGSNLYGRISRVDKVTENDRQILEQELGIAPSMVDAIINDPQLSKSYIMYTETDGDRMLGSVDDLKGLQGYNSYATESEIKRQERTKLLEQLIAFGYPPDDITLEALRRTQAQMPHLDMTSPEFQNALTENYDKLVRDKRSARGNVNVGTNGTGENLTEKEAEAARRAAAETGLSPTPLGVDPVWDAAMSRHLSAVNEEFRKSSAVRNAEAGNTAEDELVEMGFFDLDLNELSQTEKYKIGQKIRMIEGPGGSGLSVEDEKTMAKIAKLTGLGKMASELTEDQTGFIDAPLRTFKKYLSSDVEGISAESAYQSFRNLVLHSFYGSALTPTESENFLKAFGSLTQQHGAVLTQLRTTMEELRSAYDVVSRHNNDFVIKFRTGKTEEELDNMLISLDERIQYIKDIESGKIVPYATSNEPLDKTKVAPEITPESRAIMDKLSGRTQ